MTALLHGQLRQLVSVPAPWLLAAAGGAFAVLSVLGGPQPTADSLARPLHEQAFAFVGTNVVVFLALLGVRFATDDVQHGTAITVFTLTPRRERVVLARTGVAAAVGALVGMLAAALLLVAAITSGRLDPSDGIAGDAVGHALRAGLVGGLWTAIGVGVGHVVGHPVAATVGTVGWMLFGEGLVAGRLGELGAHLPLAAGVAAALHPSPSTAAAGVLTLVGWVTAVTSLALLLTIRRDVTVDQ